MHNSSPRITIVGAGAAGCFCAAQLHEALPGADIRIVEAGPRPLAKLALTGGGRCNITNDFSLVRDLSEVYPRGARLMKRALAAFSYKDTLDWFGRHGLGFVTEEGGRIFPDTQNAQDVVNVLLASLEGVEIRCGNRLKEMDEDGGEMVFATGGGPGMDILRSLPVDTVPAVPSLFAFNLSDSPGGGRSRLTSLMGTSIMAGLSIPGTKFRSDGSILLTDWGMSGPAALRLSSYAARYLAGCSYHSPLQIRWLDKTESDILSMLSAFKESNPRKQLRSLHPEGISSRLWEYLAERSELRPDMIWGELGLKGMRRLASTLLCDLYYISGKTRFREEFVTCGGVSLDSININTLECKRQEGLFFAGEILDVDAVTGGFNLQAAWSTAHIAAKSIISKYDTKNH